MEEDIQDIRERRFAYECDWTWTNEESKTEEKTIRMQLSKFPFAPQIRLAV